MIDARAPLLSRPRRGGAGPLPLGGGGGLAGLGWADSASRSRGSPAAYGIGWTARHAGCRSSHGPSRRSPRPRRGDPLASDLRPDSVAACGWRILRLMTAAAARSASSEPTIDGALARAWKVSGRGGDLLRAALILCADHELNVSAFAARCVASAGSNPYAVVIGGLAALEGTRHGGVSARVEVDVAIDAQRTRTCGARIGDRLRRGERIEGFGHPLYQRGDPRAIALIGLLRDHYAKSARARVRPAVRRGRRGGDRREADHRLRPGGTGRVLRLPAGSPLTLFAIGRTIGWIGHAIEQYATGQLIRPRAKYVGVMPVAREQE